MTTWIVHWAYNGKNTVAITQSDQLTLRRAMDLKRSLERSKSTIKVVLEEVGRYNKITSEQLGLLKNCKPPFDDPIPF